MLARPAILSSGLLSPVRLWTLCRHVKVSISFSTPTGSKAIKFLEWGWEGGGVLFRLSDHYYSINLETRKRARFGNAPEIETDPQIRLPQKRRLEASKSPARSLRKVIVLPLGSKKKRYGAQLWLYARSFLSNEPR